VTCLLTFVTGAVEIVLVANSVIDISVGSPFSIPQHVLRTSRYCHDGDMPNYGFF
ncbi:diguanylate cyclase, partial [Escherichia coli ECA-0157]